MTLRRCYIPGPLLLVALVIGCERADPLEPTIRAAAVAGSASTLNAPSGTNALAVSESRIDVTWQDNSTSETGFEIHRSMTGPAGTFTLRASTGAGVTSYSDIGLTASAQYCYKIRAFRTTGRKTSYSAFSSAACATTPAPPPSEPPLAPSFTDATPSLSTQVFVWWADNSTTEDGFRVERSLDAGATWTSAGTLGPDVTNALDDGRTSEQEVCYRVFAFNVKGDSPPSNTDCTTPPAGPTNLTVAGVDPLTWGIDLTWTDNSAVEDFYEVWACSSLEGQSFCGPIDLVPADSTSYRFQWDGYSDTYYVVATKDGGRSDESNLVNPTIP